MQLLIGFCSRVFYFFLSLVRHETRFAFVLKLSRLIDFLLSRLPAYRKPVFSLDTEREYALSVLLNSMTFRGIEFDPDVQVEGAELLANRGALLITGHFYLNFLFCRWLYDQRIPMSSVMVTERAEWFYSGTRVPFETIPPTRRALVQVKHRIAEGKIVTVAVDNSFPYENWRRVETLRKEIYMSENIVRFAVKAKIPIVFFAARLGANDEIITEIRSPSEQTAEVIFAEFDRFLDRQLALRENSKVTPSGVKKRVVG